MKEQLRIGFRLILELVDDHRSLKPEISAVKKIFADLFLMLGVSKNQRTEAVHGNGIDSVPPAFFGDELLQPLYIFGQPVFFQCGQEVERAVLKLPFGLSPAILNELEVIGPTKGWLVLLPRFENQAPLG